MCCLKCLVIRNTVSSFLKKLMLHLISPSHRIGKNQDGGHRHVGKISSGDISAIGCLIHVMFCSRVGFSGTADHGPSGILTNFCLGTSRTLRWSSFFFFFSYFSYIVLLCCLCFCLGRINVSLIYCTLLFKDSKIMQEENQTICSRNLTLSERRRNLNKKAVLPQGNRAMLKLFFSV